MYDNLVKRSGTNTLIIRGNVIIHSSVKIWTDVASVSLIARPNAKIIIGKNTFLNNGVWIRAVKLVKIGNECKIGPHVMIIDNDAHELLANRGANGKVAKIEIEDDVWLGARSIILKGVTIGKHSVVGAGSVVTHDVPPLTLVVGNPAKKIKQICI